MTTAKASLLPWRIAERTDTLLISQICRCWLQIHSSLVKFCSMFDLKGCFSSKSFTGISFYFFAFLHRSPRIDSQAPCWPSGQKYRREKARNCKIQGKRARKRNNNKKKLFEINKRKEKYLSSGRAKCYAFWEET